MDPDFNDPDAVLDAIATAESTAATTAIALVGIYTELVKMNKRRTKRVRRYPPQAVGLETR